MRRENWDCLGYPGTTRNVSLKRSCNPCSSTRPRQEPNLNSEARLLPSANSGHTFMSHSNLRLSCVRMVAMLIVLTLGLAGSALACSCIAARSTSERVADATFIVVAQVIATDATSDIKEPQGWPGFVARYRLLEVIKASTPPPTKLYSGKGAGDCGVPLFPAVTYIFLAGPEGNVTMCSGTSILTDGSKFAGSYLSHVRSLSDQTAPPSPPPWSWGYQTFNAPAEYDALFLLGASN